MASLYELEKEFFELEELLEDPEADEADIEASLADMADKIEDKIDSYIRVYKNTLAKVDPYKQEIDRLYAKKRTAERNAERLRYCILQAMQLIGKDKLETPLFKVSIRTAPPHVEIDDEDEIPFDYLIPQPPKVDKKELLRFLKENDGACEYAHIETGKTLSIR